MTSIDRETREVGKTGAAKARAALQGARPIPLNGLPGEPEVVDPPDVPKPEPGSLAEKLANLPEQRFPYAND